MRFINVAMVPEVPKVTLSSGDMPKLRRDGGNYQNKSLHSKIQTKSIVKREPSKYATISAVTVFLLLQVA